jgi:osmotically inducible protein OsmC
MSLANLIEEAGHSAAQITTDAKVTMEEAGGSFSISAFELRVTGQVEGLSATELESLAEQAKDTCPVSRLFSSAKVTLVTEFS